MEGTSINSVPEDQALIDELDRALDWARQDRPRFPPISTVSPPHLDKRDLDASEQDNHPDPLIPFLNTNRKDFEMMEEQFRQVSSNYRDKDREPKSDHGYRILPEDLERGGRNLRKQPAISNMSRSGTPDATTLRGFATISSFSTISKDNTSGDKARQANLFAHLGTKTRDCSRVQPSVGSETLEMLTLDTCDTTKRARILARKDHLPIDSIPRKNIRIEDLKQYLTLTFGEGNFSIKNPAETDDSYVYRASRPLIQEEKEELERSLRLYPEDTREQAIRKMHETARIQSEKKARKPIEVAEEVKTRASVYTQKQLYEQNKASGIRSLLGGEQRTNARGGRQ